MTNPEKCDTNRKKSIYQYEQEKNKYHIHINIITMRKFNPFRTKTHESSHRTRTSTTLRNNSKSYTSGNTNSSIPTQAFYISSPIINSSDNDVINDRDQLNENPNEEQTPIIENDNIERQISILEEPEKMSDEYNHTDDQVD